MADDSNSDVMSSVGGLMRLADPQLLMSLGFGLMAGSKYGSNAGEGLMQGMQMYQGLKTSALQRQLMQQQVQGGNIANQRQQMMLTAAQQALGQGATQPTQGGPPMGGAPPAAPTQSPQGPFLPGISPMPSPAGDSAVPPTTAPPQAGGTLPPGLSAPSMDQIYGTTYPGSVDPNYMRAMAMFSQDPAAALLKAREDQLKSAQQQYAPTISKLDTLIKSDKPSSYMKADPQLQAAWPQLAATLGFDPEKDYNDQNVRLALTHVRNQLAGSLQEPTVAPQAPLQTTTDNQGRTVQVDPLTGKRTVEEPGPMEKVIGPNGQPTIVPAAKSVGMTPFSAPLMGAANMTDQSRELAYQYYLQHQALPAGFARSPAMQADMMNYIAKRAQQDGNTQTSILASKQMNQATQSVVKDYTSGPTNKKLIAINTGVAHLDALNPLIDAMESGNLTAINKARQWYEKQTGKSAPTNYETLANMAVGEVSQAVMAGGGTGPERDALASPFQSSRAPNVLRDAVKIAATALAGKTDALRQSWDVGTNGTQGDFNKFLMPATKKMLGITDTGTVGGAPVKLSTGQSHSVGGFTVTRVN